MKLSELLQELKRVQKAIKVAPIWLCGGTPRDKFMGRLENISDLDITNGTKTIDYLSQEFYLELRKKYDVKRTTSADGHSTIFIGSLKLDFSSNFMVPNIDTFLNKLGIKDPSNMQREMYSRDFTCNSLLMDLDLKRIIDPTKRGFKDIKSRIIRTNLAPEITLTSNRNRVVRAIYLAAKLDFNVDPVIIDYVSKNPQTVKISSQKSMAEKLNQAFAKDADKSSYLLTKMNLWNYIPITESVAPYYQRYMQKQGITTRAFFLSDVIKTTKEGHGDFFADDNADHMLPPKEHGTKIYDWKNSLYQNVKKYKSVDQYRKKHDKKFHADDNNSRNFDYGAGLYMNMDKYDSIDNFLKHPKDINNIDFPVDEQINHYDQMIYPEEGGYHNPMLMGPEGGKGDLSSFPSYTGTGDFSAYIESNDIAGEHSYLPRSDFEDRSGDALNFGRDYTEDAEFPNSLNEDDLQKLMNKYLTPAESDLFGLPDGIDPISDLDPEETVNNENPFTGTSDIGTQIYDDKWNI